jgi:hypothetical protein
MRSLFISFLICVSISAFAQETKAEKKEARYQEALELINSGSYEFIARRANPPKFRSIDLSTNPNFLRIDKERGSADIPYFGRSFSAGYSSNDGGINFDGPFDSYEVEKNEKKQKITVRLKVKGTADTFTCTLNIPSLDNASLTVLSNNRQTISYTGYIQELKAE